MLNFTFSFSGDHFTITCLTKVNSIIFVNFVTYSIHIVASIPSVFSEFYTLKSILIQLINIYYHQISANKL